MAALGRSVRIVLDRPARSAIGRWRRQADTYKSAARTAVRASHSCGHGGSAIESLIAAEVARSRCGRSLTAHSTLETSLLGNPGVELAFKYSQRQIAFG